MFVRKWQRLSQKVTKVDFLPDSFLEMIVYDWKWESIGEIWRFSRNVFITYLIRTNAQIEYIHKQS